MRREPRPDRRTGRPPIVSRAANTDDPGRAPTRVTGARPWLPLPRMYAPAVLARPPHPALGARRTDLAREPCVPVLPPPPPRARRRIRRRARRPRLDPIPPARWTRDPSGRTANTPRGPEPRVLVPATSAHDRRAHLYATLGGRHAGLRHRRRRATGASARLRGPEGLRSHPALLLPCGLVQVHDPVRDLPIGDRLDCCDERTDAGWAT